MLFVGRIARRAAPGFAPNDPAALRLRGAVSLGPRRRLYLVEVAGARALVLTGGSGDVALLLPPA